MPSREFQLHHRPIPLRLAREARQIPVEVIALLRELSPRVAAQEETPLVTLVAQVAAAAMVSTAEEPEPPAKVLPVAVIRRAGGQLGVEVVPVVPVLHPQTPQVWGVRHPAEMVELALYLQ